jgi:hypothetical protein
MGKIIKDMKYKFNPHHPTTKHNPKSEAKHPITENTFFMTFNGNPP